ncbi:MAG: hypothetical protein JW940_16215 [Polyangiaceae bacterium]|nr:hypothetical protein [Polyangiaceae bacterium]
MNSDADGGQIEAKMQRQKQDGVDASTKMTSGRSRENTVRATLCRWVTALAPAAVGWFAASCGGATQLVVPAGLQNNSERLELEDLSVTAPSRTIGNYQVTFLQSPNRGREVLSSGVTVARWALGVVGPTGQVTLDCEARYGAHGKGPNGGPATISLQCNGRGTPMTLELAGKGQRQGQGRLMVQDVEYVVQAVYDVHGGKPPAMPAGYTIGRAYDVLAAGESLGPEDPGAIYLAVALEEPRRTAMMAAATALVELGVLAPKGAGSE